MCVELCFFCGPLLPHVFEEANVLHGTRFTSTFSFHICLVHKCDARVRAGHPLCTHAVLPQVVGGRSENDSICWVPHRENG
jgi:hypothetical protein